MFALLFDLEDYATTYRATRDAYLKAANELKRELEYYQLPSEGLLTPPRMAKVEIVRNVKTSCQKNIDEVCLLHKRDVEAELNSNPQLKIISSQFGSYDSSLTTVLATVDACVTSPSTVAGMTGLASDADR